MHKILYKIVNIIVHKMVHIMLYKILHKIVHMIVHKIAHVIEYKIVHILVHIGAQVKPTQLQVRATVTTLAAWALTAAKTSEDENPPPCSLLVHTNQPKSKQTTIFFTSRGHLTHQPSFQPKEDKIPPLAHFSPNNQVTSLLTNRLTNHPTNRG